MIRLAFRNLANRPLRTVLTTLAILLGVAMITGTYVLTDQIDKGFANIFETSFKGTAVIVEPKSTFGDMDSAEQHSLDAALLDQVRAVPGVAKAAGVYETMGAAMVDGKAVETGGAPTLLTTDAGKPFSQATLVAGRDISAHNEVAIIKSFADKAGLKPGDTFDIAAPAGLQHVKVVGVFTWGEAGSLGGTVVVAGGLKDVQAWGGEPGALSAIDIAAAPGVSPKKLAARVKEALADAPATSGATSAGTADAASGSTGAAGSAAGAASGATSFATQYTVQTGEQAAADATAETADTIGSFLTPVLLAFAGVAVFVGAFIIFNTFNITVVQRRREFAMLRALGTSRRQVLSSVVVEALGLGAMASALGIAAGLGVATGINALFKVLGADIPTSGLVLEPRTVLIAVLVGMGVTLVSAFVPALRATRVPPVAAMQEGSTLPPTRFSKFTTAAALLIAGAGGGSIAYAILTDGTTNSRLLFIGMGALLLFVAVAMLAKFVVRPVARIVGWPLEKLSPVAGRLARGNAARNPSRTAATAAALMIGLAMVVFMAVFAQGLKESFSGAISDSTRADLVSQDRGSYMTVPQSKVAELGRLPGVDAASGAAWSQVKAAVANGSGSGNTTGSAATGSAANGSGSGNTATSNGSSAAAVAKAGTASIYGIDPATFVKVWGFEWERGGSDALLAELDAMHVIMESQMPLAKKVDAGDTVIVMSQSGKLTELTVLGFYRDQMAFTGMVTSLDAFKSLGIPTASGLTLVRSTAAAGGSGTNGSGEVASLATTQKAVEKALADYPTQTVQTKTEYLDMINKQVDQLLMMFYGLLAMSVTISIFGIVNTLVLSVHERTREIGMLRAIGATRTQLRQMVRYESVITAVIGGLLGIVVGVAFAYLTVTEMGGGDLVFSVPWMQLGFFLVLSVIIGVLAAVLPARRAAGTRILEAIQYE